MARPKKKRGAPYGNQNARKHGFYSTVLLPDQEAALPGAAAVKGLDSEIDTARVKLKAVLKDAPNNFSAIFRAIAAVRTLVHLRDISRRDDAAFAREVMADLDLLLAGLNLQDKARTERPDADSH